MTTKRFGLLLIAFAFFVVLLVGEYLYCSVNFRLVRTIDLWGTDILCGVLSIASCYLSFKKLMKSALNEKIPPYVVLSFFLIFSLLFSYFLRFNLQIANGLLDGSEAEIKQVVITQRNISAFGGSFMTGINPVAFYIYFQNWDDKAKQCELLISAGDYYSVGPGVNVKLAVRKGFFHLPWVEDYRILDQ